MNLPAFVSSLRARGASLVIVDARLRIEAPKGVLTPDDRAVLRQYRDELVAFLTAEAAQPTDCLNCETVAWTLTADWPTPGTSTLLCRTCMDAARWEPPRPVTEMGAGLSAEDRRRLEAKAASGDALARLVVDALTEADATIPPAVAADTATSIAQALREAGWIVVYSTILGVEVIFTRDQAVEVPDEYASLPRFDRDELAVLAAQRPSPDRLRAIVDVKREIPGIRVVQDTGERLTPARDVFPSTTTTMTSAMTEVAQGDLGMTTKRED